MPLTPFGARVWLPILLGTLAVAGLLAWLHIWWAVAIIAIIGLALLSFFRDPIRRIRSDLADGAMLSPADGTVSAVISVDSHEATSGRPALIVRIFLSVLNVHVNRSPCAATVVSLKPTPGKYLNAQTEESARVNESNLITLRISSTPENATERATELIGVRQVSGMLARTIVCPLKVGAQLRRGQKFGMIMFGSTTELILPRPDDVTVHVKKGDRVKGGVTVLATLK